MPLKRTYSTSTSIVPTMGLQAGKKRRMATRRAAPKLQLLSAPGTPFPTRCRAQLKYTSYVNLDQVSTTVGVQYVRCNSVFDPDQSGAGGQPRGFDQYALLYDQYTVTNAKMKAWIVCSALGTNVATGYMAGISIVDAVTTSPVIDNCADRPFTSYKIVNPYAAAKDQTLTSSWNLKKRFPKDQTYQSLSAQIGANPAEEEFFQIWCYPAWQPLSTDTPPYTIQYEILYDVEFYELKQIPAS